MRENDIALVKASFAQAAARMDEIADKFYGRLFELDPTARNLFAEDLGPQKKLIGVLVYAVENLHRSDVLAPAVEARRPSRRLPCRGEALRDGGRSPDLEFEDTFGAAWSADLEHAWTAAYTSIATAMQDAASRVRNGQAGSVG
ncbi:MAG: hypothetical protein R3C97_07830 [Geminicoccaceae bacterium]